MLLTQSSSLPSNTVPHHVHQFLHAASLMGLRWMLKSPLSLLIWKEAARSEAFYRQPLQCSALSVSVPMPNSRNSILRDGYCATAVTYELRQLYGCLL